MKNKRIIAIHLPQMYPFQENDEWWGKGFTEWRSVVQAKPRFLNHYQPHIPADLGFYDLRLKENRIAQQNLAKEYGIDGFCYYHYWFDGHLIMEKPLELMYKDEDETFPYMFCWANGSWARNWEGGHNVILIQQKYSHQDNINHFNYMLPFFKDSRYIRINGKPVFGIHRSDSVENIDDLIDTWQEMAAKEGFQIYFFRFESASKIGLKYKAKGMEGAAEFQPFNMGRFYKTHNILARGLERILKRSVMSQHFSYRSYVNYKCKQPLVQDYTLYPCVFPSWDNSPRRIGRPYLAFKGCTPKLFEKWFDYVYSQFKPYSKEENLIFINAWNEWAEGCHLEPDMKNGRGFLEAIKNVIDKYSK